MSQDIPDKKIREQFWELDRDGLPKFKKNEITITRERLRERPAQMTARKGDYINFDICHQKNKKFVKPNYSGGPYFVMSETENRTKLWALLQNKGTVGGLRKIS